MDTEEKQMAQSTQPDLSKLWQAQLDLSKTKTCLFNLIIYTDDAQRTLYFKEMVKTIIQQFPCHIIFIEGGRNTKESYLRVSVTSKSDKDSSPINYDQVTIEASGTDLQRVPYLILPLFIPDLPIYLIWGQDPAGENTILPQLLHYATRVIFDSECAESLHQFSQSMMSKMQTSSIPIVDMNWVRCAGWREVLAQTFDSQSRLEPLANAEQIKITYNDVPNPFFKHIENQALYIQAWLASRFGWELTKADKAEGSYFLTYRRGSSSVQMLISRTAKADFPTGDILDIEISGQQNYVNTLVRKYENQVIVHASNQYQCELPFTLYLPTIRSPRTFIQEIFYQKISEHYIPMLRLISQIDWRT